MPPAFNLSQDQTLQFDLEIAQNGIEVNFTSFFREHLSVLRPRRLSTPLALAFKRPRLSAVDF
jgi:hypothetical protein